MSKRWITAWYLATAASLGAAVAVGLGQSGERPLQKIFGGAPAKSSAAKPAEELRRKAEIDIELAWLADPITFAYFLEAHVEGTTLSVRGYVPDQTVREHALKLARLHTTFTVADLMKEHPSLLVRPAREVPTQLQAAVVSTLREALPRQYQHLQIDCAADGTVTLRGPILSAEDKLAASHALRRLYGCTSVHNLTQVRGAGTLRRPIRRRARRMTQARARRRSWRSVRWCPTRTAQGLRRRRLCRPARRLSRARSYCRRSR